MKTMEHFIAMKMSELEPNKNMKTRVLPYRNHEIIFVVCEIMFTVTSHEVLE